MGTLTSQRVLTHTEDNKSKSFSIPALFGTSWENLQFNYYGIIVMTLLASSCIGSIAAAMILSNSNSVLQLSLCAGVSMFSNTTSIGGMPVKWVLGSFAASVLVNTVLIVMNLV